MKQHAQSRQTGFTMIELIVVIVILGILAATALPRFLNVQDQAKTNAIAGVAATMSSAMQVNYSSCVVVNNKATADKCVAIVNCTDVSNILQGGVPSDYEVTAAAIGTKDGDTITTCEVKHKTDASVAAKAFTGIRAGNG